MATFDETFNPAALARSDTITSIASTGKPAPGSAAKQTKATQSYPRIDLEPLYAELKSLIGHNWETYYDALTRFIRGRSPLDTSFTRLRMGTGHRANSNQEN